MIDIHVFGPTTVTCAGRRLSPGDLGGGKPRQLLEMLALELGRPVSKEVLAEQLWDGNPPRSCIQTLESYVCGLRRRLHRLSGRSATLVTSSGGYLLDETVVHVDLALVERLFASGDIARILRTLPMVRGRLLAGDPYATWATKAREDFASRASEAYVSAAQRSNTAGEHEVAATLARAAARDRYGLEPAVQELMLALAGLGNRSQALLEYEALRVMLREDLGIEPTPATQTVYMSILCAAPADDPDDVSVLLRLLKSALDADGGRPGRDESVMAEVGRMLLARCWRGAMRPFGDESGTLGERDIATAV